VSVPSGDELGSFISEFTGFDGGEVAFGFAEFAAILSGCCGRVLCAAIWAHVGLGLRVTVPSGNELGSFFVEFTGHKIDELAFGFAEFTAILSGGGGRVLRTTVWAHVGLGLRVSVPSGDELGSFISEFTGFDGGEIAFGFAEFAAVLGGGSRRVLGAAVWAHVGLGL